MPIRLVCLGLLVLALSCRTQVAVTPQPLTTCVLLDYRAAASDTLNIAVSRSPNVSLSLALGDEDARLIHRQMYETLVSADCNGQVHPGLATRWEMHDDGREWRFELRTDATFWDGVRVSLVDVIESWERNWSNIEPLVPEGSYFNVADAIAYDRLVIRLEEPDSLFPIHLSQIALAVTREDENESWRVGTGPYVPRSTGASEQTLLLVSRSRAHPVLRFAAIGAIDTRDVLDMGFDVVMARDREAISYASMRSEYTDVPLSWDYSYGVVAQGHARGADADTAALRLVQTEIARDVVNVDARVAHCGTVQSGLASSPVGSAMQVLLYDETDPIARSIGERLVAVTHLGADVLGLTRFDRVEPHGSSDPLTRVGDGTVAGTVVRYRSSRDCDVPPELSNGAHGLYLVPIIDTRLHMFASSEKVHAELGWDGVPIFFATHRAEPQ